MTTDRFLIVLRGEDLCCIEKDKDGNVLLLDDNDIIGVEKLGLIYLSGKDIL